eukprot:14112835-Alexandrium_andersonii.AAC.1
MPAASWRPLCSSRSRCRSTRGSAASPCPKVGRLGVESATLSLCSLVRLVSSPLPAAASAAA